jgi:hypothetical protein
MLSSPQLTSEAVDLDELRIRLRKMTDADLIAFGNAAQYMCSPKANLGKPPRQPFVIQLQEARAEWRRRKDMCERCPTTIRSFARQWSS